METPLSLHFIDGGRLECKVVKTRAGDITGLLWDPHLAWSRAKALPSMRVELWDPVPTRMQGGASDNEAPGRWGGSDRLMHAGLTCQRSEMNARQFLFNDITKHSLTLHPSTHTMNHKSSDAIAFAAIGSLHEPQI
jgi:hypothetical protein